MSFSISHRPYESYRVKGKTGGGGGRWVRESGRVFHSLFTVYPLFPLNTSFLGTRGVSLPSLWTVMSGVDFVKGERG